MIDRFTSPAPRVPGDPPNLCGDCTQHDGVSMCRAFGVPRAGNDQKPDGCKLHRTLPSTCGSCRHCVSSVYGFARCLHRGRSVDRVEAGEAPAPTCPLRERA